MRIYEKENVTYRAQEDSEFERWLIENDFKEVAEKKPTDKPAGK